MESGNTAAPHLGVVTGLGTTGMKCLSGGVNVMHVNVNAGVGSLVGRRYCCAARSNFCCKLWQRHAGLSGSMYNGGLCHQPPVDGGRKFWPICPPTWEGLLGQYITLYPCT